MYLLYLDGLVSLSLIGNYNNDLLLIERKSYNYWSIMKC
jgi:hypothetical protein